jgi:hypothetical protein
MYHLMQEEPLLPLVIQGIPTSATGFSDQQVVKLSKGPALAKAPDETMEFWEFLYSWGGKWIGEGIEAGKDSPCNMSWVAKRMINNSLVWVTDGSYDRKKEIDLCGVGWIIFCTKRGFCLTGTFWEKSNLASSYRAELLGLCALHLLARVVAEYYKVKGWSAMLAAITNVPSSCRLTTYIAYGPAPNAQTYAAASRQPSCFSTVPSNTYVYTDIWTNSSNGSNSR